MGIVEVLLGDEGNASVLAGCDLVGSRRLHHRYDQVEAYSERVLDDERGDGARGDALALVHLVR